MIQRTLFVAALCLAVLLPSFADDPDCPRDLTKPCSTKSQHTQDFRKAQVTQIYDDLLYPTAGQIVAGQISVSNLFEPTTVRGRVTPVGEFPGFQAAEEYFYGLASATNRVENIHFTSLTASDDKVAVQVDIFFCTQPQPCSNGPVPLQPGYGFTLTQTGFFTFNYADRVIAFDLSILNLGAAVDPTSPAAAYQTILQTCGLLTLFPNPQNHQPGTCTSTFADPNSYANQNPLSNYVYDPNLEIPFPNVTNTPGPVFSNCVAFMQSIPYGSWNRANSNTFACRELHSLLTLFRPAVHCPHTSPAGGMTCVDFPYGSFYDQSFWDTSAEPHHH